MRKVIALALAALVAGAGCSQVEKCRAAHRNKEYETALGSCTPLAEKGEKDAQLILAVMYGKGQGVERDMPKAIFWYQKFKNTENHSAKE